MHLGATTWVIPEGYIPAWSHGPEPEMASHDSVSILNTGDADAHVEITIYFADREPSGPYPAVIPARRTKHVRFNHLEAPEPIPKGQPYSSLIRSDVPVVCQYTRLDSRQAENALLSTMAYPVESPST